jgi:hypothetical protein
LKQNEKIQFIIDYKDGNTKKGELWQINMKQWL